MRRTIASLCPDLLLTWKWVVVPDEERWDFKRFFVELFEFCFPVDFRNDQRKRLSRCFQGADKPAKDVAAHIAEWSEIYNTIGFRLRYIERVLIPRSPLGTTLSRLPASRKFW
ncbi:hypothetical protein B0H11DRAFT_2009271 [Mycena galericulata]|nr:hypothetical protein B0H11DRAFT_2009271 [Mycena galericulata]